MWLSRLGGLRDVVRQELVARQLDEQIAGRFPVGQRLRVLDVGMGQGTQALFTERFATALLVEFPPGEAVARIVHCGHPEPLVVRAGRVRSHLPDRPGPPLGLGDLLTALGGGRFSVRASGARES